MPILELQSPDGLWTRINAKSSVLMFHILEEACAVFGLNSDNCLLEIKKSAIDLSAKFSNARLPLNTKIDVVDKGISLVSNQVDLTIQLPSNRRISMSVEAKCAFWDILLCMIKDNPNENILPDSNNKVVVLSQLQDQIIGEFALRNTSLNSIGIRNGRILLRLVHKECTNDEISSVNAVITSRKTSLEKKSQEFQQRHNPSLQTNSTETGAFDHNQTCNSKPFVEKPRFDSPLPGTQMTSPLSPFYEPNKPSETIDNSKYVQRNQSISLGEMVGISLEADQNNPQLIAQQPDFSNFKFPAVNEEEMDYESELVADESNKCPKNSIGGRDNVFFRRFVVEQSIEHEDIPDSFYDLTEKDIRKQIQEYRNAAESEQPLMLQSMRQKIREQAFSKYVWCIIQFNFSDAFILQSTFLPSNTVGDLYSHIRNFFNYNQSNFQLFTTPPKTVLKKKEDTLLQANLIPMSKVYVSLEASALYSGNLEELITADGIDRSSQIIEKRMGCVNEKGGGGGIDSQTDSTKPPESTPSTINRPIYPSTSIIPSNSNAPRSSNNKIPAWFRSSNK